MNDLSTLAEEEDALRGVVGSLTGPMEEKASHLAKLGVYDQYQGIFHRYVALLGDPSAGTEALKRALFLGWYNLSEPACFTGLHLVDDGRQWICVCEVADATIGRGNLDQELAWMLPYYYDLTDFAFAGLATQPNLAAFLGRADPDGYRTAPVEQHQLRHRGQMGHYWQSIFDSLSRAI
ncbi:MAG TPA: hypothetical protein VI072_18625 [Polyangiaceae bacterium]